MLLILSASCSIFHGEKGVFVFNVNGNAVKMINGAIMCGIDAYTNNILIVHGKTVVGVVKLATGASRLRVTKVGWVI
jgi:hypothetical protein